LGVEAASSPSKKDVDGVQRFRLKLLQCFVPVEQEQFVAVREKIDLQ
jgi:hypothetical protein